MHGDDVEPTLGEVLQGKLVIDRISLGIYHALVHRNGTGERSTEAAPRTATVAELCGLHPLN